MHSQTGRGNQVLRQSLGAAWRAVACGLVFASGLVASRLALANLGLGLGRAPNQAPETVAIYYLLVGSLILAIGIAPASRGIRGSSVVRSLVLAWFLIIGFAVSTTIESSIYSSADGMLQMIPVLLLPCLLLAVAAAALFKGPAALGVAQVGIGADRSWAQWATRGLAAVVAFPFVYFVFGVAVSPLVSPYYAEGVSGLVLPSPVTILAVQLLRGVLHLVALLPVMILWRGSKRGLVVALGLAFLVAVGTYDVILAYEVPVVLMVVHGVEVAFDSFVYAWLVATLLGRFAAEQGSEQTGSGA